MSGQLPAWWENLRTVGVYGSPRAGDRCGFAHLPTDVGQSAVDRLPLHHVEIALGCAAIGAIPVVRYVLPAGAGRQALLRAALRLVVLKPAAGAHVNFELLHHAVPSGGALEIILNGH